MFPAIKVRQHFHVVDQWLTCNCEPAFKLSVTPSLSTRAHVEAHLIPRIDIGINALGGIAKATVYLNVDAHASATLTLNAGASTGTTIGPVRTLTGMSSISSVPLTHPEIGALDTSGILPIGTAIAPAIGLFASGPVVTAIPTGIATGIVTLAPIATVDPTFIGTVTFVPPVRDPPVSTSYINGCIDVDAGLDVYAGADASFFGLFDKSTKVTLFTRDWDLYTVCSPPRSCLIFSFNGTWNNRNALALVPRGRKLHRAKSRVS